jgi:hypothetical protein
MAGEGGGGDGDESGCCGSEDTCLNGEGEGCQLRERRGRAPRSEVGGFSRYSSVNESIEIMKL